MSFQVNGFGVSQICQSETTAFWRKGASQATWNLAAYLPTSALTHQKDETSSQIATATGTIDESNFGVLIVIQPERLNEIKAILKRNTPGETEWRNLLQQALISGLN